MKKIDMSDKLIRRGPRMMPFCDQLRIFPWWHWKRWMGVREVEVEGMLTRFAKDMWPNKNGQWPEIDEWIN